jgi:hypothetical protein
MMMTYIDNLSHLSNYYMVNFMTPLSDGLVMNIPLLVMYNTI